MQVTKPWQQPVNEGSSSTCTFNRMQKQYRLVSKVYSFLLDMYVSELTIFTFFTITGHNRLLIAGGILGGIFVLVLMLLGIGAWCGLLGSGGKSLQQ